MLNSDKYSPELNFAAGLIREAGEILIANYGQPFDFAQEETVNRKGIVSSNGLVHRRILDSIFSNNFSPYN